MNKRLLMGLVFVSLGFILLIFAFITAGCRKEKLENESENKLFIFYNLQYNKQEKVFWAEVDLSRLGDEGLVVCSIEDHPIFTKFSFEKYGGIDRGIVSSIYRTIFTLESWNLEKDTLNLKVRANIDTSHPQLPPLILPRGVIFETESTDDIYWHYVALENFNFIEEIRKDVPDYQATQINCNTTSQ